MAEDLKPGDKVKWNSRNGEVEGEVVSNVTGETTIKGHTAKPSEENPEYEIKNLRREQRSI